MAAHLISGSTYTYTTKPVTSNACTSRICPISMRQCEKMGVELAGDQTKLCGWQWKAAQNGQRYVVHQQKEASSHLFLLLLVTDTHTSTQFTTAALTLIPITITAARQLLVMRTTHTEMSHLTGNGGVYRAISLHHPSLIFWRANRYVPQH